MKSHIDYEAAFEDYVRSRGIPCVPVEESKKATFRDAKLKSFDFIVYSSQATNWLVDIKGRRWAARSATSKPTWENWVTEADLNGLRSWENVFGDDFRGLLVFAYRIESANSPPPEITHIFREHRYVFAGVPIVAYAERARTRSPKWGTVNLSVRDFAECVRPVAHWL